MADQKTTDLNELTSPAAADVIPIVDTSDVGADTKKATVANLFGYNRALGTRQQTLHTLWGTISAALTWSAAQIYQAATTFQETVSIAATKATSLLTVNQSSTGDIAEFQDGGNAVVRIPDGGGIVLVPQAGGVSDIDGLLYYDNTATGFKRLKLWHEGHNYPVPIEPRNDCRGILVHTTYP